MSSFAKNENRYASVRMYRIPGQYATAFTPAECEEMKQNFIKFDKNGDGTIDNDEVKSIFEAAGDTSSIGNIAQMLVDADSDGDGRLNFEEFVGIFHKTKKAGVESSLGAVIKKASGVVTTEGAGGAHHSFSEEEKHAFSTHINQCLGEDGMMQRHLPLDPNSDDLFAKCHDGLLFCKLINLAVSQTVDERALNKKDKLSVYQKIENLNLALNAAKAIGCQIVNIGAQDMIEGRPILILGLLWQIIKIQLLSQISLKEHPELVLLLEAGEDLPAFMKLPPEEILMRWVNYHLTKANSSRRMTNFTNDIKDCEIYSILTHQLDASRCPAATQGDARVKAAQVIKNAEALGARVFIQPRDITDGNKKLNISFVATLFNAFPGLYMTDTEKAEFDLSDLEIDDVGDSREERVFRMWMNSLNIEDLYINNLFDDLQDGVNLLKLFERVQPGAINWKKVNMNPSTVFKRVENCNYAVSIAKDSFKFSIVNIGGMDIVNGTKKLILAIIWQAMRKYTLQVLSDIAKSQNLATAEFTEDNIVEWANNRVASGTRPGVMKSFRDPTLANSIFLLTLVSVIEPRAVDWEIALSNPNTEEEKMNNARYAISCARKFGACVFLTPEDICEVKAKMLLTFVAAIWQQELVRNGAEVQQHTSVLQEAAATAAAKTAPVTANAVNTNSKFLKDGTPNPDYVAPAAGSAGKAVPRPSIFGTPTPAGAVNTNSKFNKDGTPNKNYIAPAPKK